MEPRNGVLILCSLIAIFILGGLRGACGQSECTNGFVSLERLTDISRVRPRPQNQQQYIIPDLVFTCNGTITKWIAILAIPGSGDCIPDLQIWRSNGTNTYSRVRRTGTMEASVLPNLLYEITPDPPLEFKAGDILGILQPNSTISRFSVAFDTNTGPINYFARVASDTCISTSNTFDITGSSIRQQNITPLVALEIDGSRDTSQCIPSLLDVEELAPIADFVRIRTFRTQQQQIFPHINFACGGNITRWTIGALRNGDADLYPDLQIWRKTGDNTFIKVGNTTLVVPDFRPGVYEFSPDPPLPFQAGDVLGIFNPPQSQSRLSMYYERSGGLPAYFFPTSALQPPLMDSFVTTDTGVDMTNDLPLLTVEISVSTASETQSDSAAAIGGAVAGGVIVIGAVVVSLIVLLTVLARRQKKTKSHVPPPAIKDIDNPVYEGNADGITQPNSNPAAPIEQSQYETADTFGCKARPRTAGSQSKDPVYAEPVTEHSFINELYGMEEANQLDDAIKWGVYVPTKEQRNTFTCQGGQEQNKHLYASIYSTLAQAKSKLEQQKFFEEKEIYWSPATNSSDLYAQLSKNRFREIVRQQIRMTGFLGSGQFGTVNKGVWFSPSSPVDVAIKQLKEGASEDDRVKFLQEAAIMGQFHHQNVVQLHGVVTVGEPVMIILEFMPNGDLRSFLLKQQPSPGEMLPDSVSKMCLEFSHQTASGMEYLAKKSFVHRDLAARNILLTENKTCKIADFGMARDVEKSNYYIAHRGKIPVKWTAPEALEFKKYSTASDVWSFGALMYEIWSLGHKPFEGHTNVQALHLVSEGYRLPPPPGCPRTVYELMIQCWHPESSQRPSFSQLVQSLSRSEEELLGWSEEDTRVHPQAAVMGAPLEAGKDLYPELQEAYLSFT